MPHSQEPREKGTVYWSHRLMPVGHLGVHTHSALPHTLDLISDMNSFVVVVIVVCFYFLKQGLALRPRWLQNCDPPTSTS
jgi:hypothetical protein